MKIKILENIQTEESCWLNRSPNAKSDFAPFTRPHRATTVV